MALDATLSRWRIMTPRSCGSWPILFAALLDRGFFESGYWHRGFLGIAAFWYRSFFESGFFGSRLFLESRLVWNRGLFGSRLFRIAAFLDRGF